MNEVQPLLVLQARAEARAMLYAACEFEDLEAAVAPLLKYALDSGIVGQIGADNAFALITAPFAEVAEL